MPRISSSSSRGRAPIVSSRASVRAARRLNFACGALALSVLLDSALEHYRGSFHNPVMFTPLLIAPLTLGASAHGQRDARPLAHRQRQAVYVAAALTGLVGTGFHVYNVLKRPGRLAWQNLFYGAPLGAPMAILLSGLLGAAAEQVRHTAPGRSPHVLGRPAGHFLSRLSAVGLLGTTAEAALLHFRGAYHNPAMIAPVSIPPIGAALLLRAAAGASPRLRRFTRAWLWLTAALGLVGSAFHAWGVQRNMGGWRNYSQNLLNGPPLPAPPSFTGLALAGLAGLGLIKGRADG